VRRYGDEYASADSVPFVDGGCVKRLMNLRRSRCKQNIENEPSSKPITTLSVPLSPSDASIAIDMGNRGVSASPNNSVDANSSLSFLELQALNPDIESAA
jgi:hypothetical protein